MVQLPQFSATRCALFASVISIFFLAGCGQPEPPIIQTRVEPISVPADQQSCPSIPIAPDPDDPNTTQRDIALYLTELTQVAEHCKYDLDTLNDIIERYNALAEEFNQRQEEDDA